MRFFDNMRKPQGLAGKIMVRMMNFGHRPISGWGFSKISGVPEDARILDVGCGGGANIAVWLKKCPKGHVTGLDFSETSVQASSRLNAEAIGQNRCEVVSGDVAALPFGDAAFDLISAFETIYFWRDLEKCFAETYRVLKNDGTFMICNEVDGHGALDETWTKLIPGMKVYDEAAIAETMRRVGFTEIKNHSDAKKHWLCVTATKRSIPADTAA